MVVGNIIIGEPAACANLFVYPLYRTDPVKIDEDFITLEEAMEIDQVLVQEVGAGPQQAEAAEGEDEVLAQTGNAGTVNAVEVENLSEKPLYLLAGQVIVGGKQDRVIARDTIIASEEKVPVEVCCVEQGRWSPRKQAAGVQGGMVFCQVENSLITSEVKQVLQAKGKSGQCEVWAEVGAAASCVEAVSSTGTYNKVIEETRDSVEDSLEVLDKELKDRSGICGFLTCVNGRVETCDLFASPELLARFRDKLLRGYVQDAIQSPEDGELKEPTIESVKGFVAELMGSHDNGSILVQSDYARVDKIETPNLIGFSNLSDNLEITECEECVLHLNAYRK
jgi:hypothetical protein